MTLAAVPSGAVQYPNWMVIEPDSANREIVYLPTAPSGTTYSGVVRGISLTADSDSAGTGIAHAANVDVVMSLTHRDWNDIVSWIQGTNGSGYNNLRVGDETDSNITIYAQNADGAKPYVQYNASTNKWLISNDGVSTFDITAGGSGLTRGPGVNISASAITLDVRTSGGLRNNQGTGSQQCDVDPTIVARLDTANTWEAVQSFTAARALITTDATSANEAVRFSLLQSATGGVSTLTTGEAINGSTTPQVVCVKSSDGLLYKADANDTTLNMAIGFVTTNALITTTPTVTTLGVVGGFTGLTQNATYYVSDTAGSISTTPSTTCAIPVGKAISTTQLLLNFGKRIATGTITHSSAGTGNQDVTTTIGFRPVKITLGVLATITGSASNGEAVATLNYYGTSQISKGGFNENDEAATAVTFANFAYRANIGPGCAARSSGGNRADVTITLNSVSATGFVTRAANVLVSGAGGDSSATITYIAEE